MMKRLLALLLSLSAHAIDIASLCKVCSPRSREASSYNEAMCVSTATQTFCRDPALLGLERNILLTYNDIDLTKDTQCHAHVVQAFMNQEDSILYREIESFMDEHCEKNNRRKAYHKLQETYHTEAPLEEAPEAEAPILAKEPPPPIEEVEPPSAPPPETIYPIRISFLADFSINIPCATIMYSDAAGVTDLVDRSLFNHLVLRMQSIIKASCEVGMFRSLLDISDNKMFIGFDLMTTKGDSEDVFAYATDMIVANQVADAIVNSFSEVLPGVLVSNIQVSAPVMYGKNGEIIRTTASPPPPPPQTPVRVGHQSNNAVKLGVGLGVGLGCGAAVLGGFAYAVKYRRRSSKNLNAH